MQLNVARFGRDLAQIEIADLSPTGLDVADTEGEDHIFSPSGVESVPVWKSTCEVVHERRPHCLMIDSVTQLRYLATNEYQFRKNILGMVNFLNNLGITSLFAIDPCEMLRDTSVALAVDGVLRLQKIFRSASVSICAVCRSQKMRGSDFMSGRRPMRIGPTGIEIFPHRIEHSDALDPGETLISSGITGLD